MGWTFWNGVYKAWQFLVARAYHRVTFFLHVRMAKSLGVDTSADPCWKWKNA